MKRIIIISIILSSLFSCEKIYYPDENAYRDPDLIGTWQKPSKIDTILMVFTNEGYRDIVYYIDNDNYTGYTGLAGIWHITQQIDKNNNVGVIYSRSTNSNFSHRGWERYEDYYFSPNKDTLYKKIQSSSYYDAYTKYRLQLIYEGGGWVGIDSTKQE